MKPNLLIFFFLITLAHYANASVVDSLRSPKLWLEEQNTIGQKLLKKNQEFGRAVSVFKSAHDFAVAQNLSDQFTELFVGYGIALYRNGDIQNSYHVLVESLPKIEKSNLKLIAEVDQILGMTLVFQNKFPEGYEYQIKALKYYSEVQDSVNLMGVYYDLGSNFGTQGQSELALENYEKGIEIAKAINDSKMTILGITAIGNAWASMGNLDKALEYIDESMVLANSINDQEELAWASINRGHILCQQENYKDAEFYLQQAYDLSFKIENKLLTGYALEQVSEVYLKQNQLDKALSKLDESYVVFQELGQVNSIKGITKKYADIYFEKGDFSKYKKYTDEYIEIKDSLYSKEMMESMANLKQDFELSKMERENQIALLTKDKELAKAKSKSNIAICCGTIASFVLLLLLMQHRNRAAKEKNSILAAKNSEILRQNESLVNSNRDLEKFAYIISHDLKEPLRNINGFTKLLVRKLKIYSNDNSINEYASFITNGTKQMEELLNGLLEYSKIGVNKNEKEIVNLNQLVEQVINNLKIQLLEKKCTVEVAKLPNVNCRSTQFTQVFQNLVANAIKFGKEEGNKISIEAKETDAEYCFSIKDQGIGIDPEYQKDIFEVFKRLHNRGTYSGSGIGLATCKKIVEDHGGRIRVESKKDEGACFYFTIPKDSNSKINTPSSNNSNQTIAALEMV